MQRVHLGDPPIARAPRAAHPARSGGRPAQQQLRIGEPGREQLPALQVGRRQFHAASVRAPRARRVAPAAGPVDNPPAVDRSRPGRRGRNNSRAADRWVSGWGVRRAPSACSPAEPVAVDPERGSHQRTPPGCHDLRAVQANLRAQRRRNTRSTAVLRASNRSRSSSLDVAPRMVRWLSFTTDRAGARPARAHWRLPVAARCGSNPCQLHGSPRAASRSARGSARTARARTGGPHLRNNHPKINVQPPHRHVIMPTASTTHDYQPRSRHSARCGRCSPRVESSPWPG